MYALLQLSNFCFLNYGYWVLVAKRSALKNSQNQTYSFVVYPKWHPWYDYNHEAWNVDGDDEKGQLPRKSQIDTQTTVSTWKKSILSVGDKCEVIFSLDN